MDRKFIAGELVKAAKEITALRSIFYVVQRNRVSLLSRDFLQYSLTFKEAKREFDMMYRAQHDMYAIAGGAPIYLPLEVPEPTLYPNNGKPYFQAEVHLPVSGKEHADEVVEYLESNGVKAFRGR